MLRYKVAGGGTFWWIKLAVENIPITLDKIEVIDHFNVGFMKNV
jgi:hypothetical protein